MYSLPVPTRNALADYDSIVARRRPLARRGVLVAARPDIAVAYGNYHTSLGHGDLIQPLAPASPLKEYLYDNYDSTRGSGNHHDLRDEISASARDDKCVYCGCQVADSLDHVLPRAVYPEFSILAENLVPACTVCNRNKGNSCSQHDGTTIVHPYFDVFPTSVVLFATVTVTAEAVTWNYYLQTNGGVDPGLFDSLKTLFDLLRLDVLYRRNTIGEISDRLVLLEEQYEVGGPEQVRDFLLRDSESARRRRGENYWKAAILRAFADNPAFCDGGFRLLLGTP